METSRFDPILEAFDQAVEGDPRWGDDYDFDKKAVEVAEARGLVVVLPDPNQLQIDCDTPEALKNTKQLLELFDPGQTHGALEYDVQPSQTEGHYHVVVTREGNDTPFTEWERIALQAALGDDPWRVCLNSKRLYHGAENPSRLFQPPRPGETPGTIRQP